MKMGKKMKFGFKFLAMLSLLGLGGCAPSGEMEISQLYTGHEMGSWYQFSTTCSATLCPPN